MGRRAIWVPWDEQPQEAVQLAPDYADAAFGWLATAPERNFGSLFERWTRQGAPTLRASELGLGWRSDSYNTNNRWTGPSASPSALNWPGVTAIAVVQTAGSNFSGGDNYAGPISWVPVGEFTGGFNLSVEWTSSGTGRPIYWRAGNDAVELSPRGYGAGVGNDYVVGDRLVIVGTFVPSSGDFTLAVNRNGRISRVAASHLSSWVGTSSLVAVGGYERSSFRTTQHYTAMAMALPRAVLEAEQIRLAENPWQLFEPRRVWVPVSAGGGAANLAIADATHGHTADNLGLSSVSNLTVADALHGHAADNIDLDTAAQLTVADATHAHAVDLALTSTSNLTISDATHGHAADNLDLTAAGANLVIQDATHAHSADALSLASQSFLTINEARHLHSADNLVLSSSGQVKVRAGSWLRYRTL